MDITKSPRFKSQESEHCLVVPKNASGNDYQSWTVTGSVFGYPSGSLLITRTNFILSEIRETTLVVTKDGKITAGETENVSGIVDFIQIDLRRAK